MAAANLAARFCVGLLTGLALLTATVVEGHAQSSTPSITVASRPAQFRFVGQVMKLTYTLYSGSRVFKTATVDPRGFGPVIPDCDSPPDETNATFTCTSTYTVTPLNMISGSFSGAPIMKWTAPNGSKTGANVTVPLAPPDTNPPNLTLPSNITVDTDAGKNTAVVHYAVSAQDPEDDVADLLLTGGLASGSAFPLGVTTVSYSATDPSGNTTNGSFTVTVEDHEKPVVTVPTDISDNAPDNTPGAAVTFAPTAADNVDADPPTSCTPVSGSTFAIGETQVSCTATDAAGNISIAKTFKVTINDVTAPNLTVPADIAVNTDAGKATAKVAYTASATDAGDPAPVVSCLPASGSDFAVGETTVSCTATDASNNVSAPLTFKVTVSDNQAPVVTPPANIIVGTDAGVSTAVVPFADATATDNVDTAVTPVVVPGSLPSGSAFPFGTTTVSFEATDAAGNKGTASFTVTVQDREGPSFTVPADIRVATAPGANSAVVTYATPTATDNVDASSEVTCNPPSGSSFAFGENTVDCWSRDAAMNITKGAFLVTVTDAEAPTLTLPPDMVVSNDPGATSAVVNYPPVTVQDAIDPNPTVTCTPDTGSTFPLGETTVDCLASDASGNTAKGAFKITVEDKQAPVLSLPADISVIADAGGNAAIVTYAASAHDDVDGNVAVTCNPASGSSFAAGETTVSCSATDAVGNIANGSFKVTVRDAEAPTLSLPANIVVNTDAGKGTAKVTYTVSATDVVDGAITPIQTAGLPSGADFPVGTITVSFRATDKQGNYSSGSFTVTVEDHEAPVVTVPANITVNTAPGMTSAVVTYSGISATDNFDGPLATTQTAGLASGASFPMGTTTQTFRAIDSHGNTGRSSFTVTVVDREVPVVTVPADIVVDTDPGKTTANVTYAVTATDNFSYQVSLQQIAGLASGADFPVGVTTVTFQATDFSGNVSARKSFTVTVRDNQAPTLTVPANITVATDPGKATANVTYVVSASDLVDGDITPVLTAGLASGADFPVGTTTVAFTATDREGNSASGSFTVTVEDDEAPVLTVPDDISVSTDPGLATATVTFNVSATDAVDGIPTLTQTEGPASGSSFPICATKVTFKATDAKGNSSSASFTVTVTDGEPPVLTVPANIAITIAYGETGAVVTWTTPTATDNASGVTVTQTTGLASGATYPLGTTTNTFQALDTAGNTVTAAFTVTVSSTQPGNVTFLVNSPSDGRFGFSSSEPALNLAVNSSGGHGSSGAITLPPGTYNFAFTAPNDIGIASAQCSDPGSSINTGSKSGSLTVASGASISCTISTSDSADKAVALIGSFLESRSDIIIANQPDIDRRIERLTGAYSGNGGMTAFGMPIGGSQLPIGLQITSDRTTFGYSLQRARMGEEADTGAMQASSGKAGAPVTPLPLSAYSGQSPATDAPFQHAFGPTDTGSAADTETPADPMAKRFDVWTEGTIGRFKSGSGDGSFGIAHAGADYLLSPGVLIGLGVQVDWLDQDGDDGAAVSGVGYLVGPYATVRLSDHFYVDARAGWGQSFNQVSPLGTFEDKFDGNRWLASAALIGSFDIERWKVKPEARVTMFEEKTDAYVDGLGVDVPSVDVRTGQFAFGPNISTDVQLQGGLVMTPFVDLQGIWTFMQDNSATSATATPGLAETGLRGRAETGFALSAGNGMSINASAFYDGLGSDDYSAWGGKLGLNHRF